MQLFVILRVFAVKEDCSEKEEGSSGKESCQKKGPPQALNVAWLASTQFFVVDHSLSTKVDTAHSYLRNMKLCSELVEFEQSCMGRKATCMCL